MARNQIKFRSAGFRRILMGGGVASFVTSEAYRIKSRAGKGTVVRTVRGDYGGGRTVAFVRTNARTPVEAEQQRERLEAAAHGG